MQPLALAGLILAFFPSPLAIRFRPFKKTIFDACLSVTVTYNAAELLVLTPLLR
jgi:hypothetical protein